MVSVYFYVLVESADKGIGNAFICFVDIMKLYRNQALNHQNY